MKLKYILDKYGNFSIFTDSNTHADMAKGFYEKPISAGFCTIALGYEYAPGTAEFCEEKKVVNVHCFGESVSLGLKSREEDETIINKKLNSPY